MCLCRCFDASVSADGHKLIWEVFRQTVRWVDPAPEGGQVYGYDCNSLWRLPYKTIQWTTLQSNNDHCSYWYVNIISLCASNKKCPLLSSDPAIALCTLLWSLCEMHIVWAFPVFCMHPLFNGAGTRPGHVDQPQPKPALSSCGVWLQLPVSRSGPELQGFSAAVALTDA